MAKKKVTRGRPASAATIAKRKAIAAGTYEKGKAGRPKSEKTVAVEKAKAQGIYVAPKKGRPKKTAEGWQRPRKAVSAAPVKKSTTMTPAEGHNAVKSKAHHDPASPAHGEHGVHKRGNTTVSVQVHGGYAKKPQLFKIRRRMVKTQAGAVHSVTSTLKESGPDWQKHHSNRQSTHASGKVVETDIHHAADPRRSVVVRSTKEGDKFKTESTVGKRNKVMYPGFSGIAPPSGTPMPSAKKMNTSVGSLPKPKHLKKPAR